MKNLFCGVDISKDSLDYAIRDGANKEIIAIEKIKTLLTFRRQYVKIRTQFKNAVKSLKITAQIIPLRDEIKQQEKEISKYNDLIKKIETQIKDIINGNKLLNKNYKKITAIVGIGLITGSQFIVSTNNFTAFENPRKFNCYCGLAPFEYSSGVSDKGRTKTSHYRDKELKAALFKAAVTAITHDMQLKTYYNRKINEEKHKMSVINAVACKLVYRPFAVVKREEPFVRMAF